MKKQRASICVECGQLISPSSGKIPFFRRDQLAPAYCHVKCYKKCIPYFEVGHHNIIKRTNDGYIYFWRGQYGEAKTKQAAEDALGKLIKGSGL